MSPAEFSFTLTIPADATFVGILRDLTLYAANYAKLSQAAGWSLADRVVATAERTVASSDDTTCQLHVECGGGELTVTVGGERFSHRL